MNCPYCNTFVPKDEKKCPRCGKRIVTDEEYLQLLSETEAYKDRQEKFKFRVALVLNFLFPGLGVYVKTGNITLFLLMIILYGLGIGLTVWTFVTGKGTPLILVEPIAMHAVSIFLLIKEKDRE